MAFRPRFLKHKGITVIQKLDPSVQRLHPGKVGIVLAGGAVSGATDARSGGRYTLRSAVAKMASAVPRLMPTGLFDPRALQAYLKRQIARTGIPDDFAAAFKRTGKELYLTATDLNRGELVVF